MLETDIS